jgi:DNA-binding HxlR family transcriptional regulator
VPDYEKVCLIRADQGRAIRALLDRIADKWALLIIATLHAQRLRFTELQQRIPGISQRMLTLTLRKLERDGLVIRTAHAEVPPRVEYERSPSPAGLSSTTPTSTLTARNTTNASAETPASNAPAATADPAPLRQHSEP